MQTADKFKSYTIDKDYLGDFRFPDEHTYDEIYNDQLWLEEHIDKRWRCNDVYVGYGNRRTYSFDRLEDLVLFKLTRC